MSVVTVAAPDSIWQANTCAKAVPDSLWQAVVTALPLPDRLITAPIVAVACPDRMAQPQQIAVATPDSLVTGTIPVPIYNTLYRDPGTSYLNHHEVSISYGLEGIIVKSPPILSVSSVKILQIGTGYTITDPSPSISGDKLSVILSVPTSAGDIITIDYRTQAMGPTLLRSGTPAAWAKLTLNGTAVIFETLRLSRKIKGGWSWSATMPNGTLNPYVPFEQDWRITINDGLGYEFTSPPLVALPREVTDSRSEQAPSASVSGVDKTTYRMGVKNKSFDTFKNTTSVKVLQALASSEGLTISGVESYPIIDEDAKQIMLASAIGRVIATTAQEWEVDTTGRIILSHWAELAGWLEVDWSTIKHKVDLKKRYTSLKIGKRSARHGGGTVQGSQDYPFTDVGPKMFQLSTPLYNPEAFNRSTLGFVDLVAFYDGDPTRPSSTCISVQVWNQGLGLNLPQGTPNGRPATHCTCYVFNPGGTVVIVSPGLDPSKVSCLLRVTGTPPAVQAAIVDTEPEFLVNYDSGITPSWPAPDWVDNLPPTKAWAISHAPDYVSLLSKGWDTLSMEAVCHANVHLRQTFPYNGFLYKTDEVSWSCGGSGVPTTQIELVRV